MLELPLSVPCSSVSIYFQPDGGQQNTKNTDSSFGYQGNQPINRLNRTKINRYDSEHLFTNSYFLMLNESNVNFSMGFSFLKSARSISDCGLPSVVNQRFLRLQHMTFIY
jgi:hypothetical protein